MSLATTINQGLKRIEARLDNQTFTWNSEDYVCVPSSPDITSVLEVGGFDVQADLVIKVRKELFTAGIHPKQQQKLTFKGRDYRIGKVIEDMSGVFFKLLCSIYP